MSSLHETIRWVRGNTRPLLKFTLKDRNTGDPYDPDTWLPLDLTGTTVTMQFRRTGTTTVIDTLSSTFDTDGTDGKVTFTMTALAADNPKGNYEGEIDIDFGLSNLLTVYDVVPFLFREGF